MVVADNIDRLQWKVSWRRIQRVNVRRVRRASMTFSSLLWMNVHRGEVSPERRSGLHKLHIFITHMSYYAAIFLLLHWTFTSINNFLHLCYLLMRPIPEGALSLYHT